MENQKEYEVFPYPTNAQDESAEDLENWTDKAFAPLMDFLAKKYPGEKENIGARLMFMGHGGTSGTDFFYKNSLTRKYIVINVLGIVVKQEEGALI